MKVKLGACLSELVVICPRTRSMINSPPPFRGLNIRISILIPIKGRVVY